MEIEILNESKDEIDVKFNNVTTAEVLRAYLYKEGIEFAAWRREHPSEPVIMKIKSSGKSAKKSVSDAISAVKKDLDKLSSVVKKK